MVYLLKMMIFHGYVEEPDGKSWPIFQHHGAVIAWQAKTKQTFCVFFISSGGAGAGFSSAPCMSQCEAIFSWSKAWKRTDGMGWGYYSVDVMLVFIVFLNVNMSTYAPWYTCKDWTVQVQACPTYQILVTVLKSCNHHGNEAASFPWLRFWADHQ